MSTGRCIRFEKSDHRHDPMFAQMAYTVAVGLPLMFSRRLTCHPSLLGVGADIEAVTCVFDVVYPPPSTRFPALHMTVIGLSPPLSWVEADVRRS
jgi:hypothetical protein